MSLNYFWRSFCDTCKVNIDHTAETLKINSQQVEVKMLSGKQPSSAVSATLVFPSREPFAEIPVCDLGGTSTKSSAPVNPHSCQNFENNVTYDAQKRTSDLSTTGKEIPVLPVEGINPGTGKKSIFLCSNAKK